MLNIGANDYIPGGVTETAGARVIIHDPGSLPNPSFTGYDVHPGTLSRFAVKKVGLKKNCRANISCNESGVFLQVHLARLKWPYASNCYDSWSTPGFQPLTEIEEEKKYIDTRYTSGVCTPRYIPHCKTTIN